MSFVNWILTRSALSSLRSSPTPPLQGVQPSDQMHDMLISMCTEAQRLEEAVDLVKRLARQPRAAPHHLGAGAGATAAAAAGGAGAGGGSAASGNSVSHLQDHTLNSLIRALCGKYVDRALRLLSLCCTMGMRPSRRTYLSLITGCAKASRSAVAYDLYRSRECACLLPACLLPSCLLLISGTQWVCPFDWQ